MDVTKFERGDLVHIAADLPICMSHFQRDQPAIIMEQAKYEHPEYAVLFTRSGKWSAWYPADKMHLIGHVEEYMIALARR